MPGISSGGFTKSADNDGAGSRSSGIATAADFSIGSQGLRRSTLDSTGALSRNVAYRLNLAEKAKAAAIC